MEEHRTNEFVEGRTSDYTMRDTMQMGKKKLTAAVDNARQKQTREAEEQRVLEASDSDMSGIEGGLGDGSDTKSSESDGEREHQEPEEIDTLDDGRLFVD